MRRPTPYRSRHGRIHNEVKSESSTDEPGAVADCVIGDYVEGMVAEPQARKLLPKHDPATGKLLAELPCTDPSELPALVERARKAQVAWGALGVRERNRRLMRVAHAIAARAEELSSIISSETGKPLVESLWLEVFPVADLVRYFAKRAHRILSPKRIGLHLIKYRRSYVHYAPRGVVGVISPWNFPFTLAAGDIFMALAAGNAVVHKGSEWTPLITLETPKLLAAADIDPELVQVAVGYGDVGQALVTGGVDMVHFTGSVATGRKVAALCGERLIPCVLELGGKDPAIVLDDADVEHTARTLVFGGFANAGQACAAVERVYATPGVYDALVERVTALVRQLRVGDGSREDVEVGPMIMPRQLEIVRRHVDEAKARGATVRTGGESRGSFYLPTVLTEVNDDMAVCKDETFGPVLPIMKVRDAEDAIERANRTEYGLSAYVFTRNQERGRAIAERLRAGTVDVNEVLLTHGLPETPWGGVKASGVGFTHSDEGLRNFCEARHVNYGALPDFRPPWHFPYRKESFASVADVVRGLYGGESLVRRLVRLGRGAWGIAKEWFAVARK
jgi:acyl-CoA reductase-like NAD-dependent aldehyde dehydrogenase